ncbi:MAG TPA: metal ABC transporter ATP-binding protein [Candidatus Saccharimonadales bacterium]|nr:metal ABC transporter ATP-binding protein [Candidatus Saccharimonadales bacterium]
MNAPLIALSNVSFRYGHTPVLDQINLEIHKGEYVGVIGPNGGGKTTLLKLILGLLHPQEGTVELFGKPTHQFKEWPRIGYVSQHVTNLDTRLPITVAEVVALGRVGRIGLLHFAGKKDRQAVEDALHKVDMWPLRHRLLSELSGGQQQRVFIAKALASEPEVLLLDEPTVGIDVPSQEAFYRLLAKLNTQEKLTLVMVSHDIDVVVNEVTRVACINETLIYHGAPKEFMEKEYMANLYGKGRKFILHNH